MATGHDDEKSSESTIEEETETEMTDAETGMGAAEMADSDVKSGSETAIGLEENLAGALAYLFSPLTGLMYFIEPENEFVRFHSVQSMIFGTSLIVVYFALTVIGFVIPILPWLLSMVVAFGAFIGWAFLMYQAYSGKMWAIPGLGGTVSKYAAPKAVTTESSTMDDVGQTN